MVDPGISEPEARQNSCGLGIVLMPLHIVVKVRGIIHVVLKHSMLTSMRIYACYAVKTYKTIFFKNKQEWGGGVTGVPVNFKVN